MSFRTQIKICLPNPAIGAEIFDVQGNVVTLEVELEGEGFKAVEDISAPTVHEPPPAPTTSAGVPKCPDCGGEMRERAGSRGPFYGCAKYPACKGIVNKDGSVSAPRSGGGDEGPPCPDCGAKMYKKTGTGKNGKPYAFWGCGQWKATGCNGKVWA